MIITITDYNNRIRNTVSCSITMISSLTNDLSWWIRWIDWLANSILVKWITISTSYDWLRWETVSITIWSISWWAAWWEWISDTVLYTISILISLESIWASLSWWNTDWNWRRVWSTTWAWYGIIFCSGFSFDLVSHSTGNLGFHSYFDL